MSPQKLKEMMKLKIQKMSLWDQTIFNEEKPQFSKIRSFGMIKDDYYYYIGDNQNKLGVVNYNEKTDKWKLCHMTFIPNCKLVEFCKESKLFICAVQDVKKPKDGIICDLKCYKDGKISNVNLGNLTEHLSTTGINLELGFRKLSEITIFVSNDNLIIMLYRLEQSGLYEKMIKLSNKFIKESISDIVILSRNGFVVLGSKGYVGLYKRKTIDSAPDEKMNQLAPSSFLDEEQFTFKIESQLDVKMTP